MINKFIRFLVDLARELSDETAYARHLDLVGRSHSSAEWRLFIDARYSGKYGKAKCC
jgi:hypothetical protein